jgi:hypothetical protein
MKSELKWSINEIIRLAGKRFDDKANAGTVVEKNCHRNCLNLKKKVNIKKNVEKE